MDVPTVSQSLYVLRLAGLVVERPPYGVQMTRPATKISLLDVIRATDNAFGRDHRGSRADRGD